MGLTIVEACAIASESETSSFAAVFLTVLFSAYIALDSFLSALVIVRKASEAECVALGGSISRP